MVRGESELDVERLDQYLAQLNSGEADLETLLEGQADELQTLLKVAALVRATPHPTPSPEAVEAGRRRLMRAVMEKRKEQAAPAPSFGSYLDRVAAALRGFARPRVALRPATVLIVALVMVLALTSAGVTRAAANSLPDSPLYSVKLATEQIQLVLTPSMAGKARLYITFGERRLRETQALAEKGQSVHEGVLQAMRDQNARALEAITQLPEAERQPLLADFASLAEKEWMILKELKERIPPDDHPPVDEAIAASAQDQELAEEAQKKPEATPEPSPTSTVTLTVTKPKPTPTVVTAVKPTAQPTKPTSTPEPTKPTPKPTEEPEELTIGTLPTEKPTATPTPEKPTSAPTAVPTTVVPTATEVPTVPPTLTTEIVVPPPPTEAPPSPTPKPTSEPTEAPTEEPTSEPTEVPTEEPTPEPTEVVVSPIPRPPSPTPPSP
jgi:hypothetical protein